MKKTLAVLLPTAFFAASGMAGGAENSCMTKDCAAGTKAVTYAIKGDFYYACPTMELAEYTNTVVGVVSVQAMFGSMPNISPATGEPETTGETKALLDILRSRAKVRSFDQAMASCSQGKTGVKVLVANNPKDKGVIWVSTEKTNEMFWMPKGHLDLRK